MGWNTSTEVEYASILESRKKKVVGEPDEEKPHVRFDVAGDGNQDMVKVTRHSQKKMERNGSTSTKSQAPFPDPTSGQRLSR